MKSSKALLIILGFLFFSNYASALTTLKKIQVKENSKIDLFFDKTVSKKQVNIEYFNDVVQFSISDVSIYPAKIIPVSGKELSKVFAYQYGPKLVRCRLSVKGVAEKYKNRFQMTSIGKTLSIRLLEATKPKNIFTIKDNVVIHSAQALIKVEPKISQESAKTNEIKQSEEEKELLAKVLQKNTPNITSTVTKNVHSYAKPLPSIWKSMFGVARVLVFVLILFCVLAFTFHKFRRLKLNSGKSNVSGVMKWAEKFSKLSFPNLGLKNKMIDVVANHYLGPKKNIVVIRVAGKYLVLGVSNESINLITQLEEEEEVSFEELPAHLEPRLSNSSGAVLAGKPQFFDLLSTESTKPSIRSQIRSKIEGLKQL